MVLTEPYSRVVVQKTTTSTDDEINADICNTTPGNYYKN